MHAQTLLLMQQTQDAHTGCPIGKLIKGTIRSKINHNLLPITLIIKYNFIINYFVIHHWNYSSFAVILSTLYFINRRLKCTCSKQKRISEQDWWDSRDLWIHKSVSGPAIKCKAKCLVSMSMELCQLRLASSQPDAKNHNCLWPLTPTAW